GSERTMLSYVAQNTTNTTTSMIISSMVPIPMLYTLGNSPPARRKHRDDRSNEPPGPRSSPGSATAVTGPAQGVSSQNVTGPSLTSATCMSSPNTPEETGA